MKRGTRALTSGFSKKICPKSKRSQMKLSFGMIFSIILIIIFLAFAFYAMQKFLEMQRDIQIGQFIEDLQADIDKMWQGLQGSQEVPYILPKKIKFVCFVDYNSNSRGEKANLYNQLKQVYQGYENLFFYPVGSAEGLNSFELKHIDLIKITEKENPFCIENKEGRIKMIIKKGFYDNLVCIGEHCKFSAPPEKLKTSKSICVKAEDADLCNALDFVYGTGYKKDCCSEHNLCC